MHIPKYRHFAARDKGFVEYAGKRTYFPGKFNSPESIASYAKFLEPIFESDTKETKSDTPDLRATRADDVPVNILVAQFLDWGHYVKNGRSTGTYERFRGSITPLLIERFGGLSTSQFGPNDLRTLRKVFVDKGKPPDS